MPPTIPAEPSIVDQRLAASRKELETKFAFPATLGIIFVLIAIWFGSQIFAAEADSYWINIFTDGIGIAITILVIDRLNEYRSIRERKQTLFKQLKHPSNDFALDALIQIKDAGWWEEAVESHRIRKTGQVYLSGIQWQCNKQGTVDLSEVTLLENALLLYSNMTAVDLTGANLSKADFYDATLSATIFRFANLEEAHLVNAEMSHADISGANFKGVKMAHAILENAHCSGTDFENANMYEIEATNTDFQFANLSGAVLSCADLRGAVLFRANLANANLNGAVLNEETVLPDSGLEPNTVKRYIPNVTDMRRYTDRNYVDANGHPDFYEPEYLKSDNQEDLPLWLKENRDEIISNFLKQGLANS